MVVGKSEIIVPSLDVGIKEFKLKNGLRKLASNKAVIRVFTSIVRQLAIILVFGSVCHLNAFPDRDNQFVDVVAYCDIKKECYHFLYGIHRNLIIWEWSDSVVKQMLKANLEDYLVKYLDTPEAHKLYLKYEAMDWDIHAMMKMHLSDDE